MLAPLLSGSVVAFAVASLRIDVQLTPDVWTDITCDVVEEEGVHAIRGMRGSGPLDVVASTGTMTFSLRNDSGNSGSTQGWYSPNHASVRSGWTFGIPVRLVAVYGTTDFPLWRGKIRKIQPTPGHSRIRRVRVTAHDLIGDLADARVRGLEPHEDATEAELLEAVLEAAAPDADTTFDVGLDEYSYAFDDIEEGTSGLSLSSDITMSARGKLFVTNAGGLRYRNRQQLAQQASGFSITENHLHDSEDSFVVPADFGNVYNRVSATIYPRTVGSNTTTMLYTFSGALPLPPSIPVEMWGSYRNPDSPSEPIGGTDFQNLIAGSDYIITSDQAGTIQVQSDPGSNTIVTEPFASTVKFTITNTYHSTIYLQYLQLRGRAIYNHSPLTVESYEAQDYGDKALALTLRYQDDINVAQSLVKFLRNTYQAFDQQVEEVVIRPQGKGSDLLLACLQREIGDVVTVSETMTGLSGVKVAIQGIEWQTTEWPALECRWIVAPHRATQAWVLGDNVAGVLGSTTILGYA